MADRFLSFDAFGPYRAGGIVDAVVDRFEREGVDYRNVQARQGDWSVRYPHTAQEILDDEAQRQIALRVMALVPRLEELLTEALADVGCPVDLYALAPMVEALCESLDIAHDLCATCARTAPLRALDAEGRCPTCIKEAKNQ